MLTDIPEAERFSIQKAVFDDQALALSDPTHPGWHFSPPAHFMLDVWGAIDRDGWHHIFYGVCRKAGPPSWDTVFGHARTRDFVHYEHLPFPICPAVEELRMNDGCLCVRGDGLPVLLYTSVPKENIPRSHWAAIGTPDMLSFRRCSEPFMTLENHGGPAFGWGWSDPFVFEAFGRRFMLMSKCTDRAGHARMPIYESTDDSCTKWEYRGIIMEDNGEVVNFFPVGDKWVMIFCPYGPIRYFTGTFDEKTLTFAPEKTGILSYGYVRQSEPTDRGFYATCVYLPQKPNEKPVLCGWMSGFDESGVWCGCMGTPREVAIDTEGHATTMPIRAIEQLRTEETDNSAGNRMEIGAQADLVIEFTGELKLDFTDSVLISITEDGFAINGLSYPGTLLPKSRHRLRILLDRSFAELYFDNGAVSAARPIHYVGETLTLHITGNASVRAWKMKSAATENNL